MPRATTIVSSPVTARMLLMLLERPRVTSELAVAAGIRSQDVAAYLAAYRRRGWVRRSESGRWELTEEGRRRLEPLREWLESLAKLLDLKMKMKEGE